jgi:DNA-binding transcriptional MerR regulator
MSERYLTTRDVARIADVTPAAVRLAAATGRLSVAMVTLSGVRLYTRAAAERYASERAARRRGGDGHSNAAS